MLIGLFSKWFDVVNSGEVGWDDTAESGVTVDVYRYMHTCASLYMLSCYLEIDTVIMTCRRYVCETFPESRGCSSSNTMYWFLSF